MLAGLRRRCSERTRTLAQNLQGKLILGRCTACRGRGNCCSPTAAPARAGAPDDGGQYACVLRLLKCLRGRRARALCRAQRWRFWRFLKPLRARRAGLCAGGASASGWSDASGGGRPTPRASCGVAGPQEPDATAAWNVLPVPQWHSATPPHCATATVHHGSANHAHISRPRGRGGRRLFRLWRYFLNPSFRLHGQATTPAR